MKKIINFGKLRGLQQISSPRGTFIALALDHRQDLHRHQQCPDAGALLQTGLRP